MTRLRDIAVVRSKNAGPLEITFDVIFHHRADYDSVMRSGQLSAATFAKLYGVSENQCLFTPHDVGQVVKCTLPRRIASGSFGETDVYGSQQSLLIADLQLTAHIPSLNTQNGGAS